LPISRQFTVIYFGTYDWAGQIRTVELNKGGDQLMFRRYIQTGMADVHRRIVKADYFKGRSRTDFATGAGEVMGDINYVHPFREGNGRTQLLYLKQLSIVAGHPLDPRRIPPQMWIEASKRAHQAEYALVGAAIRAALERST
jgi:cell filamentation protein